MKIDLPKEVHDFLKIHATKVDNKDLFEANILGDYYDVRYYFLPFWIRVEPDKPGEAHVIDWDHLPKDLRDYIINSRKPVAPLPQ